jgi:50S ribosomal protein L16 3-hydroxylase
MLYLPPGVAHHGVALGEGMTWSIGMRAPSAADLFQTFGEWLADSGDDGGHYRDPALEATPRSGEIDSAAISQFRDFFQGSIPMDEDFSKFLGLFLSRYRVAHEPAPPADTIDPVALIKSLELGLRLKHNPWTRLLWIEFQDGARLFAAGTDFSCTLEIAQTICDPDRLYRLGHGLSEPELTLLCRLLNRGHLYLEPL